MLHFEQGPVHLLESPIRPSVQLPEPLEANWALVHL